MTYNLNDFIDNFRAVISSMEESWPDIVASNTQDALAMIEDRITTTGKNPKGEEFKPYTTQYLRFKSNPKAYKRGKDLGLGSNRYTGKVDYTLTGEFWRDVQILERRTEGIEVVVRAGVSSPVNKAKMESLTKRDGFPLKLSEEERNYIRENTINRVKDLFNPYFSFNQ